MTPWTRLELAHVVIRVAALDRMVGFYRDVLGLEVVQRQDALGLVHLRAGSTRVDLLWIGGRLCRGGLAPDHARPNLDRLCLAVSPWDRAAVDAHLAKHCVAIDASRSGHGTSGEAPPLFLTDPEGNGVEIRPA